MEKRLVFSMVISIMVVLALLLAGCTCGAPAAPPEEEEVAPPEEEEVAPPEEEEVAPADELGEILSRAKSVTSVKYEIVLSFPGATVVPAMAMTPMKVWAKGNKMRVEMSMTAGPGAGQDVVSILDADTKTGYAYLPAQNMAIKQPFTPPTKGEPLMQPADFAEWIADEKPLVTGSETVDGKECLVAEITVEQGKGKLWIWKKYGIPLRMEAPNPQGGTMVMEWKNVEVVNIPDSMFELPAGVQIQEQ